jgi:RNA polymerase sigma-70 factor (ECF subfamily)
MRKSHRAIVGVICLGIAGIAGVLNMPGANAQNAKPVLTVATARPVVVKTEPQAGDDQVDASITEIKVTFSKDMQDGSWAFAQMSKDSFPQTSGKPHYESDKRTCVLPVKLEPGKTYVILLNKPPYDSFMDTGHRKAMEYWLVFATKQ